MKKNKSKKTAVKNVGAKKKTSTKKTAKAKPQKDLLEKSPEVGSRFKKMTSKIGKSTKKMVDEVLFKLIGSRSLEHAQEVSAHLKKTRKARGKR